MIPNFATNVEYGCLHETTCIAMYTMCTQWNRVKCSEVNWAWLDAVERSCLCWLSALTPSFTISYRLFYKAEVYSIWPTSTSSVFGPHPNVTATAFQYRHGLDKASNLPFPHEHKHELTWHVVNVIDISKITVISHQRMTLTAFVFLLVHLQIIREKVHLGHSFQASPDPLPKYSVWGRPPFQYIPIFTLSGPMINAY